VQRVNRVAADVSFLIIGIFFPGEDGLNYDSIMSHGELSAIYLSRIDVFHSR